MNIGNPAFFHQELKDLVPAANGGVMQRGLAVVVRHIHLQEKNGTTPQCLGSHKSQLT
jgi:hypothetical protein